MIAKNKCYVTLFISFLFLCGNAFSADKAVGSSWVTGTYSNFAYNREAGDLNGVEIRLIFTRTGIKGVIQFAEGRAGDVALVDVKTTGSQIHFEMPSSFQTQGAFEGIVSEKGIKGVFKYSSGAEEPLILPRSTSYWDKHR